MSVSRFFRFFTCLILVLLLSAGTAMGEKTVLLTFTGDCTIGCTELTRGLPDSFDSIIDREGYEYPFLNYRDFFAEDDCTVINMEGVLSDSHADEQKGKTFRFRGKTDYVKILTGASIEAAGLANNHINDFWEDGLKDTRNNLDEKGIVWSDDHYAATYTTQKGIYVAAPKNGKARTVDVGVDTLSILLRLRDEQAASCISQWVFTQDSSADPMDIAAQGYSFPSGHSSNSSVVMASVAYFFKKKIFTVLAVIIPARIAF